MRTDVILQMQQQHEAHIGQLTQLASRAFELKEAELQAARAQAHQMQDVLAACMGNLAASVSTPPPTLCVCADCQSLRKGFRFLARHQLYVLTKILIKVGAVGLFGHKRMLA